MQTGAEQLRVVPCDYDTDPGRWAVNQAFRPAGNGELAGHGVAHLVVADLAEGMLSQAPRRDVPGLRAEPAQRSGAGRGAARLGPARRLGRSRCRCG